MSTIITPGPVVSSTAAGGNSGWIVSAVVLIAILVLGFIFWPQLMAMSGQQQANATGSPQPANVTNNNTIVNATSTTSTVNATTTGGVNVELP